METENSSLEKILSKIRYRNVVISVSHSNYKIQLGGTEKVLCEEQKILYENGISYIHFFPKISWFNGKIDNDQRYLGMSIDSEFLGYYNVHQLRLILYILEKLNVKFLGINIHHTLGINIDILDKLIDGISKNIKFFLHDYYSVCPQYNLLKNGSIYCGNMPEGEDKCLDCVYWDKRKETLRSFKPFFEKYNMTFIAPSQIAKEIWVKTYKSQNEKVRVIPHQVVKYYYRKSDLRDNKIKLAYVGYQSIHKGWQMWKFVTENIDTDNYELYHLGGCSEQLENVNNINVSFHESGRDAMIKCIKDNKIDIVLLWSIWPETYSYTYFESYAAGAFVITNNISGNICEKVRKNENGIVFENINDVLKFLSDKENVIQHLKESNSLDFPLILESNTELLDELKNLVYEKNEKFKFYKEDLLSIINEI
jgi:hypothetical protein